MSDGFNVFLEEHGITRETSAPRTPQQNGVAERMIQTLVGGARAMLQHSGMSKGFWAEAMGAAAHVLNRAPRKGLGWRTPYELLFGRVPEVSYFRVFGCRAWVYNDRGKKWDPKSKPMIFVGYGTGSKAFRLWDPASRSVVASANVRFDEREFPNKQIMPKPPPTPPTASSSKVLPLETHIQIPWFSFDEEPKPSPPPSLPPTSYPPLRPSYPAPVSAHMISS